MATNSVVFEVRGSPRPDLAKLGLDPKRAGVLAKSLGDGVSQVDKAEFEDIVSIVIGVVDNDQ